MAGDRLQTSEQKTWADRYYVKRSGLRWHVMCGTGTWPIARFWRWHSAERIAHALYMAFSDGKYVGEAGLQPGDVPR